MNESPNESYLSRSQGELSEVAELSSGTTSPLVVVVMAASTCHAGTAPSCCCCDGGVHVSPSPGVVTQVRRALLLLL